MPLTTSSWNNQDLFCHDLPTKPIPGTGKILITGASGYVGGRLVPELLARGYQVRIMVRGDPGIYQSYWLGTEVVVADASNQGQLAIAFHDIDTAYYLIHSLRLGPKDFKNADRKAAQVFRNAAEESKIKRIIYLGGLGDILNPLSPHLRSRIEVGEELKKGEVTLTALRAAIIIGSGSASYEIIQHLVKKLPVIFIPPWAKNRCQPIAIRDVIKYLVGVLETPETIGRDFDIGGPDILTYEQMLKILSRLLNKNTPFISTSFSYLRFYSYLASLLTPVPYPITQGLMEGLRNEVIVRDDAIRKMIPFEPLSYKEALIRAMTREEQDRVYTRWSDAYPPAHELALKLHELDRKTTYQAGYDLLSTKDSSALFQSISRIGGKEGWFHGNRMWRLWGTIDRMLPGVSTSRGRKSRSQLKINDVLDFWRVEDLVPDRRLLLRAEMRFPGKAWLEFTIKDENELRKISVVTYYHAPSYLEKIYWYLLLPFHHFLFKHLLEEIERRS